MGQILYFLTHIFGSQTSPNSTFCSAKTLWHNFQMVYKFRFFQKKPNSFVFKQIKDQNRKLENRKETKKEKGIHWADPGRTSPAAAEPAQPPRSTSPTPSRAERPPKPTPPFPQPLLFTSPLTIAPETPPYATNS
jgi:hypothetical protein